jgi:hypothetical protein
MKKYNSKYKIDLKSRIYKYSLDMISYLSSLEKISSLK